MFIIEDEFHGELQEGRFATLAEAVDEVKRRAGLPWDEPPNRAPCADWRICLRRYEIVEYDMSTRPWKRLQRIPALEISAAGVTWLMSEP